MKYQIDETDFTPPLAVCLECDWRGFADTRLACLKRLAIHEEFIHPQTGNARNTYYQAAHRARVAATKTPGIPPRKGRKPATRTT